MTNSLAGLHPEIAKLWDKKKNGKLNPADVTAASKLENAGISDLRIHDLRRTVGSYMAMAGVNTPLIQKALGHKSMAAASIYQRVNNDPVKQGMDLAIKTMQEYAKASQVAEMRRTKKAK